MDVAERRGRASVFVRPIKTEEFPRPAPRPNDSRLESERLQDEIDLHPIDWELGLTRAYRRFLTTN